MGTIINQVDKVEGTTQRVSLSMSSLEEENKRLRAQLAELQGRPRQLEAKHHVTHTRSVTDQGQVSTQRQGRRWSYRDWMNPEHHLVPQNDSVEMDILATDQESNLDACEQGVEGLHRRSVISSQFIFRGQEKASLRATFPPKRKLSDIESCSSNSSINEDSVLLEKDDPFLKVLSDRAGWLVGLLILQSCSSFILKHYEELLQSHLVLVQFLTMLVGAGGNAGNQASVRVIRGLAVGTIREDNVRSFLWSEMRIGICLSLILGVVGFVRAAVFLTPLAETMAITISLFIIVIISIAIGATLPLLMNFMKIDPAHSSTTIQVLMDILGVTITVFVSGAVLNSSIGEWLSPGLYSDVVNNTQTH